ncbi:hypothetical protein CIHG_02714 [Coccidioides immitis H538.4]|uniref:Uncharacterized protein n=2 Tax=Coccidioides immitis TaxID=5501 RepID=A0A0J8RJU4_COCIT|nr:hypothetical protein CIRG_03042 [Coccidioides immitis RMSCC 2394]KMU84931.1 hypothetical protein CIHG_02714 [Coccidioides immitis H538.4]
MASTLMTPKLGFSLPQEKTPIGSTSAAACQPSAKEPKATAITASGLQSSNRVTSSTAEFQIEDIPPAFRDLCGIGQTSDSSNNPYYLPLPTLFVLMRLEPSAANLSKLVIFVGQMLTGYRSLIQKKDPRALLILAYWFGLMCSVDQWWIQDRVRSECRAIYLIHIHKFHPYIFVNKARKYSGFKSLQWFFGTTDLRYGMDSHLPDHPKNLS